jgi:hypothetical protein
MKSLIARISCTFIFITFIQFSAKAQDSVSTKKDTDKVIVIVTPGQKYKKPAGKYVAPSTAERSGAVYGDTVASKPIRTTTNDYNTAPTTSERTGYPAYMDPNYQKPHTQSNVAVGVNGISSTPVTTPVPAGGNTAGGSSSSSNTTGSTSSNITTTTTTTTTTLPDGKKTVNVTKKSDTVSTNNTDTVTQNPNTRSMKMLFAEVGGPGLAISLNYDARFNGERKGLGFRIGAGYFSDGYGNTVFTIPMQVNYLLTKDENNFIELGGGTTFLNSTGNNKGPTFIFDKVTGFIGTATIGYRYQPVDHKLNFRIDFVPIFYDEGIIWAGGVSIGYNFK